MTEASTGAGYVSSASSSVTLATGPDFGDALAAWAVLPDDEVRELGERTLRHQVAPVLLRQLGRQEILGLLAAHHKSASEQASAAAQPAFSSRSQTAPRRASVHAAGTAWAAPHESGEAKAWAANIVPEAQLGRYLEQRLGRARSPSLGLESTRPRSGSPVQRRGAELGRDTAFSVPFRFRQVGLVSSEQWNSVTHRPSGFGPGGDGGAPRVCIAVQRWLDAGH